MNAAVEAFVAPVAEPDPPSAQAAASLCPDLIFIRQLRLDAHIGAYAEERRRAQTLEFDLEIGRHGLLACASDRLADTIDYADVVDAIRALLAASRVHLLEALAEAVAELLFDRFGAHSVTVGVAKRDIVPGARWVGVRIRRARRHPEAGARPGPLHSVPCGDKARPA